MDLGHVGARGGFVLSVGPTSSQNEGRGDDSGIVSPGDPYLVTFKILTICLMTVW